MIEIVIAYLLIGLITAFVMPLPEGWTLENKIQITLFWGIVWPYLLAKMIIQIGKKLS